ncbi:MAG: hypothetical protein WBD22_04285 [Pyrinomonadaceae bacterium]
MNRTIAKFRLVVIFGVFAVLFGTACDPASHSQGGRLTTNAERSAEYGPPIVVGTIGSSDIKESSGLAASQCQADVFWTHNDSGGGPFIYALNATGNRVGTWKMAETNGGDWEGAAVYKSRTGECFVYIGSIGNNELKRSEHTIYRFKEPAVPESTVGSDKESVADTGQVEKLQYSYPDGRHNAETLMVHPETEDIYVLSKNLDSPSRVYKIKPRFETGSTLEAEMIAEITVPSVPNGFLTGGDISPDGTRVVVCDYLAAYEFKLPTGARSFDDVWKSKPAVIQLGEREQGEAIGFSADGRSIIATSEKKNSPMIVVKRL